MNYLYSTFLLNKLSKGSHKSLINQIRKEYCFKSNKNNPPTERYNPEEINRKQKKIKLIDRLPQNIQFYFKLGRFDRPVGYIYLFLPSAWGLTLGAASINILYFKYFGLIFTGAVLMRSAGCIINDLWDQDIDKKVIRTQDRPLASGKITAYNAAVFLSIHLSISLWILLQLPLKSIISGLGIMPIVIMYPYMKRITNFPQFFLGLSFSSGVVVCYPILKGFIDFPCVLSMYFGGVLWTLIYDTIYAHMDKNDDKKINVKSTALYFDEKTKPILTIFTIIMIALIYYSLSRENKNSNSKNKNYISNILLLTASLFQFYLIYNVNLNSPMSCLKHFNKNAYFGVIILLACLFSKLKL